MIYVLTREVRKMNERKLAKRMLYALYDNDLWEVKSCIRNGANSNWVINGYPYLFHAIENNAVDMTLLLVENDAMFLDEALWYAIKTRNIKMSFFLLRLGAIPKKFDSEGFERPCQSVSAVYQA